MNFFIVIEAVQDTDNNEDYLEETIVDSDETMTVENDNTVVNDNLDQQRNLPQTASAKKRKISKSYGGALLDFGDSFAENLKEVNKEFLAGQALLQQQQQEFERQMVEDDREFLRSLFQPNN